MRTFWFERFAFPPRDPTSMLGVGPKPAPAAPGLVPPPEMPDPYDPAAMAARRKAMLDSTKGGRASTTLTTTAGAPTVGAGPSAAPSSGAAPTYSKQTLGGGM